MVKKIIILLLFVTAIQYAQGIKVNAYTDKRDYLIGDSIGVTFEVQADDSLKVLGIDEQFLNEFELSSALPPVTTGNKTVYKYGVAVYDSNKITIPPVKIFYAPNKLKVDPKELDFTDSTDLVNKGIRFSYSQPVNFLVNYVQVDTTQGFKDIRPPKTVDDGKITVKEVVNYLIYILIAAAIVLAVLYYLRKRKNKPVEIEKEFIPSEWALEEINKVDAKKLWQNGEQKEYHSELTGIIRKYFEYIFDFPSLELTTEGTLKNLEYKSVSKNVYDITKEFLDTADLVKFAKAKVLDEYNIKMLELAKSIVESTKKEKETVTNQDKPENV